MRGLSGELLRIGHPTAGASVYGGGKRLFRIDFTREPVRAHQQAAGGNPGA